MREIDNCYNLSKAHFTEKYFNQKPVIDRNQIKLSKCYTRWSFDYLKFRLGSHTVKIKNSKKGIYNHTIEGQVQEMEVLFDHAIELFTSTQYDNKAFYLQQVPIAENFPELLEDLENSVLNSDADYISEINLWIGGAGCISPLHYDRSNNFLMQVRGRKEIIFFSPEDSKFLYPGSTQQGNHVSEINLDYIDVDRFPLFKNAEPFHSILEAGDVLYIPIGWWHNVRSLEASISINYWWNRFSMVEDAELHLVSVDELCKVIRSFTHKGFSIDHRDEDGEILLLKAVYKGYSNLVEAFLLCGANPNSKSVAYNPGTSAITIARENGSTDIINLLVKHGAGEDLAEKMHQT